MKYQELRANPPLLEVKEGAREVIFDVVSSMCDNKNRFHFKKNEFGEFQLSHGISAYSNFGLKVDKTDLEWLADDEEWEEVISHINDGYQLVAGVRSR